MNIVAGYFFNGMIIRHKAKDDFVPSELNSLLFSVESAQTGSGGQSESGN